MKGEEVLTAFTSFEAPNSGIDWSGAAVVSLTSTLR